MVAECAGEQGRFWDMHHRLFAHQRALEPWTGHAEALGLDVKTFEACLESEEITSGVRRDMAVASSAGASGTPSFVLGITKSGDPSKVVGLAFIRGAQPFGAFKGQIDKALADLDAAD